jgi:hypothetical protein
MQRRQRRGKAHLIHNDVVNADTLGTGGQDNYFMVIFVRNSPKRSIPFDSMFFPILRLLGKSPTYFS